MRKATYEKMKQYLTDALGDMSILAGDTMGPSNASWQDVAGTAIVNFECLIAQLKAAREGNAESFLVFPSPSECLDTDE